MRREFAVPLREMPQFRFKIPEKNYPNGLVDRGLVRPAVFQLAKMWGCDYETAHRIIKEHPLAKPDSDL